ncbi:MAG TPA: pseudouridine synthase [Rubrobacter sp.]|nr:pseudouridine synthase [Rubrobacter sp.]
MRLQAFLARAGAAPSRRKAEMPILEGRVSVNGETATLGATVTPEDEVELDGQPVYLPADPVSLALNKPAGYLTSMRDDRGRNTVADLMPDVPGLVPAGRLDADTTGLLILTNDGQLAHRITHPSSEIEKQYRLTLENPVSDAALAALAAGPTLEDGRMHAPELTNLRRAPDTTSLDLIIHEGRNRIIRRACAAVGLRLISLRRTRVGPVSLGDLPEGEYRPLTARELEALR